MVFTGGWKNRDLLAHLPIFNGRKKEGPWILICWKSRGAEIFAKMNIKYKFANLNIRHLSGVRHYRRGRCSWNLSTRPTSETRLGQTARILYPGRHLGPGHSERIRKSSRNFHFKVAGRRSGWKHRPPGGQRWGSRGQWNRGRGKNFRSGKMKISSSFHTNNY